MDEKCLIGNDGGWFAVTPTMDAAEFQDLKIGMGKHDLSDAKFTSYVILTYCPELTAIDLVDHHHPNSEWWLNKDASERAIAEYDAFVTANPDTSAMGFTERLQHTIFTDNGYVKDSDGHWHKGGIYTPASSKYVHPVDAANEYRKTPEYQQVLQQQQYQQQIAEYELQRERDQLETRDFSDIAVSLGIPVVFFFLFACLVVVIKLTLGSVISWLSGLWINRHALNVNFLQRSEPQ